MAAAFHSHDWIVIDDWFNLNFPSPPRKSGLGLKIPILQPQGWVAPVGSQPPSSGGIQKSPH